jgi:hypothetical protein
VLLIFYFIHCVLLKMVQSPRLLLRRHEWDSWDHSWSNKKIMSEMKTFDSNLEKIAWPTRLATAVKSGSCATDVSWFSAQSSTGTWTPKDREVWECPEGCQLIFCPEQYWNMDPQGQRGLRMLRRISADLLPRAVLEHGPPRTREVWEFPEGCHLIYCPEQYWNMDPQGQERFENA